MADATNKKRVWTEEELAERDEKRGVRYLQLLQEATANPNVIFPQWAAARFLTCCESTLATWRREGRKALDKGESENDFGQGPRYVRMSGTKVGYPFHELVAYNEQRTYAHTSAERSAPKRPGNRRPAAEG